MQALAQRSSLVARPCCRSAARAFLPSRSVCVARASNKKQEQVQKDVSGVEVLGSLSSPALAALFSYVLTEAPASAVALSDSSPFAGVASNSLYVTLGLFVMCVPGIWSLVKRAPQATKKRMTFEVPGPAVEGAVSLDDRARQIFRYFKRYNYTVKETGEVITFEGIYAADKGQAAALVFYLFCGMASVALVLSILVPQVGNWWYALTAVSPAGYYYYMQRGTRSEQFKVKMVTADDEKTTDITVEGDKEEIERFWKELGLVEKGKVLVKGML